MSVREDFILNAWHVVATSSEVDGARPFAVRLASQSMVLFRTGDGRLVAMEDICPHRQAPLSLGRIEGNALRCMYHGLLFSAEGRCIEIPGQDIIPPRATVATYPVAERFGWIWIWLGDEPCDESLLPPAVASDHPELFTSQTHIDYEANYGLVIDNLLDLSHLSYVHASSFKADPKWANIRPKVTPGPRGVFIERWLESTRAVATARHIAGQTCDTWQGYHFLVPGVLIMETLYCEAGSAQAAGLQKPEKGVLVRNYSSQAITGTGPRSSRYFFAAAIPREGAEQRDCDRMLEVTRIAFDEDRAMIEAQQRSLDANPGRRPVPTAADGAIAIFHRLADRISRGDAVPQDAMEQHREVSE